VVNNKKKNDSPIVKALKLKIETAKDENLKQSLKRKLFVLENQKEVKK